MRVRFLLALTTLTAAIAVAQDKTPDAYVTQGEEAFKRYDLMGAMAAFRNAAEQGNPRGMVRLGEILDYAEQNEEAVTWFRKAAEQGDTQGQFRLGMMYSNGEGVGKNDAEALKWFERAAAQGNGSAVRVLANAYEKGTLGLAADPDQAVSWLQRGVELRDTWSVARLKLAYEKAQLGLPQDSARALELDDLLKQMSPPRSKKSN